MNTIAKLQEKPHRGSLAIENDVFSEDVRQLLYGTARGVYLILFTIKGDTVFILFVRHATQSVLKQQLFNPGRYLQAAKASAVELAKKAWEKSLIATAIIAYLDKLSEDPNQGA